MGVYLIWSIFMFIINFTMSYNLFNYETSGLIYQVVYLCVLCQHMNTLFSLVCLIVYLFSSEKSQQWPKFIDVFYYLLISVLCLDAWIFWGFYLIDPKYTAHVDMQAVGEKTMKIYLHGVSLLLMYLQMIFGNHRANSLNYWQTLKFQLFATISYIVILYFANQNRYAYFFIDALNRWQLSVFIFACFILLNIINVLHRAFGHYFCEKDTKLD